MTLKGTHGLHTRIAQLMTNTTCVYIDASYLSNYVNKPFRKSQMVLKSQRTPITIKFEQIKAYYRSKFRQNVVQIFCPVTFLRIFLKAIFFFFVKLSKKSIKKRF